jgi:transcriptional regulator with XRE-family HTH domain
LRHKLGLSQKEFAVAAGISERLQQQLEQGAGNPTLETLNRLGGRVGVPWRSFLRLERLDLHCSQDVFLRRFRTAFQDCPYGAALRAFNSAGLWGNAWLAEMQDYPAMQKGPFSVVDLYEEAARRYMQAVFREELAGKIFPFPLLFRQLRLKESHPLYATPVQVQGDNGRARIFLAMFFQEMGKERPENYRDFCSRLLDCAAAD